MPGSFPKLVLLIWIGHASRPLDDWTWRDLEQDDGFEDGETQKAGIRHPPVAICVVFMCSCNAEVSAELGSVVYT